MSTRENSSAGKDHNNVGEILSQSERFIDKYKKQLIIGVGAAVLLVIAILGVRHLYILPKEAEAEDLIFKGQDFFARDMWDVALFGDSVDYIGFEAIIDQYGSTTTGNLAKAYAGVCYYRKGEPEKALEYLKGFSASDDMIDPAITGLVGDCYVDLGKVEDGISYFKKAASKADNELLSPVYLKKAGVAYESLKKYKDAKEMYSDIKNKYPNSSEALDIDKYIGRAESLSK